MGIKVGQETINSKHIDALTHQIKNNNDCEVINLILDEHLSSVQNLFDDIKNEQAKILRNILPILGIPGPTPDAIVAWIQKLVTGLATPQLEAHIKYTKKVIQLTFSIAKLVAAIEESHLLNINCGLKSRFSELDNIKQELEGVVNNALLEVSEVQNSILNIIDIDSTLSGIDTSSVTAFVQTVDSAFSDIEIKVNQFQNKPLDE